MLIYLTRCMVRFFEPCALLSSELSKNLFELKRNARKKIAEVATCQLSQQQFGHSRLHGPPSWAIHNHRFSQRKWELIEPINPRGAFHNFSLIPISNFQVSSRRIVKLPTKGL